jgi:hypothetical protein
MLSIMQLLCQLFCNTSIFKTVTLTANIAGAMVNFAAS